MRVPFDGIFDIVDDRIIPPLNTDIDNVTVADSVVVAPDLRDGDQRSHVLRSGMRDRGWAYRDRRILSGQKPPHEVMRTIALSLTLLCVAPPAR